MNATTGNIWTFYDTWGAYVAVPTNGFVKQNGLAVMGTGLAAQAAGKFYPLAASLGQMLAAYGNHVFLFPQWRIITFPVKDDWRDSAKLLLINRSAVELQKLLCVCYIPTRAVMPKVGCGNGGLQWEDVGPLLTPLGDAVQIVDWR